MRSSSTLIIVGLATTLNIGIWIWSHSADAPVSTASNQALRCETLPAVKPGESAAPTVIPVEKGPSKPVNKEAAPVDQPWVNTVRDNVLQASLMPNFADKVLLSGVECKGSKCEISGSTRPNSNGGWHGSSDISEFMQSMSDGQIAGGDTDRSVALNQIRPKADGKGMDFSLTVQQDNGPPRANPCQSIMDAWKDTHPEDFADNPFMPAIKPHQSPAS
jgi:hypothetical protein